MNRVYPTLNYKTNLGCDIDPGYWSSLTGPQSTVLRLNSSSPRRVKLLESLLQVAYFRQP